jgi:hypothetical protein
MNCAIDVGRDRDHVGAVLVRARSRAGEERCVMKRALQVTLDVREPSVVELTVGDRVQLDRLVPSGDRFAAERHGALLHGVAAVALEPGFYSFRTLSDASLRVVCGGVAIAATSSVKDPPIPPPARDLPAPADRGDQTGDVPVLAIEPTRREEP